MVDGSKLELKKNKKYMLNVLIFSPSGLKSNGGQYRNSVRIYIVCKQGNVNAQKCRMTLCFIVAKDRATFVLS